MGNELTRAITFLRFWVRKWGLRGDLPRVALLRAQEGRSSHRTGWDGAPDGEGVAWGPVEVQEQKVGAWDPEVTAQPL